MDSSLLLGNEKHEKAFALKDFIVLKSEGKGIFFFSLKKESVDGL